MTRNKKIAIGAGVVVLALAAVAGGSGTGAPEQTAEPSVAAASTVPSLAPPSYPIVTRQPESPEPDPGNCGEDLDCRFAVLQEMLCEVDPLPSDWEPDGVCADGTSATTTTYKTGDTASFTYGGEENVFAVKVIKAQRFSYDFPPDAGNKYIIVDVQISGTKGESEVSKFDFTVVDDDGRTYDSDPDWKEPGLPSTSLAAGEKIRGWLTFQVPKAFTKGWVRIGDADSRIEIVVK